jgi:hypothetical protein
MWPQSPEQFAQFLGSVQHLPFAPQLQDRVLNQFVKFASSRGEWAWLGPTEASGAIVPSDSLPLRLQAGVAAP